MLHPKTKAQKNEIMTHTCLVGAKNKGWVSVSGGVNGIIVAAFILNFLCILTLGIRDSELNLDLEFRHRLNFVLQNTYLLFELEVELSLEVEYRPQNI